VLGFGYISLPFFLPPSLCLSLFFVFGGLNLGSCTCWAGALFALDVFQIVSHIYVQAGLNCDSSIYASHMAGMTGVHHHTLLLLGEMGSLELFAQTGHKP
jgi:hypothetical protein